MQEFKSVAPASSAATATAADDTSSATTTMTASAEPAAAPAKQQQKLGQNEESKAQTEPGCFYCGLTSKQYRDKVSALRTASCCTEPDAAAVPLARRSTH